MLTVMTPTYNRANTLPACYQSLLNQTRKDFIWMIIDDGSVDQTENLVREWISLNQINILYFKKENGGKASALNLGIENLATTYACCLDSDDLFYPDTVRLALEQLEDVREDQNCCGLLALRHNPDGTVLGGKEIPKSLKTSNATIVYQIGKIEAICFYKSEIIKQYRFPSFPGEKFISPAWLDCELSRKYYFKISWDKLCCCEYIDDGLTKNKVSVIIKNPRGYTCVKRQSFELATSIKHIIKHGIMYNCGCILCNDKHWLKNAPRKGWALVLRPLGWVAYFKRFYRKRVALNLTK